MNPFDKNVEHIHLTSWFMNCQVCKAGELFHGSMICLLKELGSTFYKAGPLPAEVEPHPERVLGADGSLAVYLKLSHQILAETNTDWNTPLSFLGKYKDGVEDNSFQVSCFGITSDHQQFDDVLQAIASTRLDFFHLLLPLVQPRVAFIDHVWGSGLNQKRLDHQDLKRLYWTTYFGPEYVSRHGREFLLQTPAWKTEEISNGVLITVTEKFIDFAKQDSTETLRYLRLKFPGIRANRFKIDPSF